MDPRNPPNTSISTCTEPAEDVVALLGEGDFVDRVPNEAGLEQVVGVLARISPVREALHVREQPLDQVGAWGIGNL